MTKRKGLCVVFGKSVLRGLSLGFDSSVGVVMPYISMDLPRILTLKERLHSCFAHALRDVGVSVVEYEPEF